MKTMFVFTLCRATQEGLGTIGLLTARPAAGLHRLQKKLRQAIMVQCAGAQTQA